MKLAIALAIAAITAGAALSFARQDPQEASAPSPEMLARMNPGPMHQKLQPLAGEWQIAGKWRMTPEEDWQEFTATMTRKWIMDGRFLQEDVKSEFMGQPFAGMGLIGYDNVREEYTSAWVENMSTGIMVSTGSIGKDGVLSFEGEYSNSMTGEKNCWAKSTTRMETPTKHIYSGFAKDASGKEFQNMEMIATKTR